MTVREVFEYTLVELDKVASPTMLLSDFNYFLNKAIYQYQNKKYNLFEISQQNSDDLRTLKATATLPIQYKHQKYICILPEDYLHMLNCTLFFEKNYNCNCSDETSKFSQVSAVRLTADMKGGIYSNYYNKPSFKRPYYYINYNNIDPVLPTGQYDQTLDNTYSRTIQVGADTIFTVPKKELKYIRYGNPTPIEMEVLYGKSNKYEAKYVTIDYLKNPQVVHLSQLEIDQVDDTSQIMEFQEYVCYEIINELVKLILENNSDPRLQTHTPINQTIATPIPHSSTK